jgi:GAF domain-containing protein
MAEDMHDVAAARLLEAGRSLVAALDLEVVLERLLETARELTGARYAAIGVLDERRQALERFLTSGVDAATHAAIGDLPRGRGILGVLIEDPRPLVLADVGAHPRSYGFPHGHPPMRTFLGVPIVIRGEAWGNLYLTEKAGGEFGEADVEAITVLADWAAIAIDHAHLYRRSVERSQELERAIEGLEATTAISRALGAETELGRVLELVVKRGRALVRARAVVLLLADGGRLVAADGAGQIGDAARTASLPVAGTVAGAVLESGRPERIDDVAARFAAVDEALGVPGAETALLVPLRSRGRSLGVLCAFDRMDDAPGIGDRISETQRRLKVQLEHNEAHGINPETIRKAVTDILAVLRPSETAPVPGGDQRNRSRDKVNRELANLPGDELRRLILTLEEEMHEASTELRFEYAARLRDEIKDLKRELRDVG